MSLFESEIQEVNFVTQEDAITFPVYIKLSEEQVICYNNEKGDFMMYCIQDNANSYSYGNNFHPDKSLDNRLAEIKIIMNRFSIITWEEFDEFRLKLEVGLDAIFDGTSNFRMKKELSMEMPKYQTTLNK